MFQMYAKLGPMFFSHARAMWACFESHCVDAIFIWLQQGISKRWIVFLGS